MVNGKVFMPKKKHTVCQTCFHKHYWGEFCHVFFQEVKEDEGPTDEEKAALKAAKKAAGQVDLFDTDSDDDEGSGFEGSDLSEEVRCTLPLLGRVKDSILLDASICTF